MKLFSLYDKLSAQDLLKNNLIDEIFTADKIREKTLSIAKRYETIDYSEIKAIKSINPEKISKMSDALQKENKFLLSCIRQNKNKEAQKIHRIHY
jgi:enoyl-CoA hydratase/carnithine racemase